jgi:hypothetical protein
MENKYSFDHTTGEGQKRLMYLSMGIEIETRLPVYAGIDTGADPIGDGTFKMYPSGDIVDFEERNRRLTVIGHK